MILKHSLVDSPDPIWSSHRRFVLCCQGARRKQFGRQRHVDRSVGAASHVDGLTLITCRNPLQEPWSRLD